MILIALGANLPSQAGAPEATMRAALRELPRRKITVRAVSSFYATSAWPDPADPPFVNAVASIATELPPAGLLAAMRQIEVAHGRIQSQQNAPRTLDLDLLDYEGRVEAGPPILPHPRLQERGFVLVPLSDVAPQWRHPVSGRSVNALIAALPQRAAEIRRLPDR
jgi:2-amino-4-hydroxy-6-hydroxymethyldihydropteridine diphosphokinase